MISVLFSLFLFSSAPPAAFRNLNHEFLQRRRARPKTTPRVCVRGNKGTKVYAFLEQIARAHQRPLASLLAQHIKIWRLRKCNH